MDLLQLQYFREIARTENISKAAERLFVSQPTLSGSLSRLEESLGAALFERRRGKITLTRSGRQFLTCVESVLDALDDGVAALQRSTNRGENSLRIASSLPDLLGGALPFLPKEAYVGASVRQITCESAQVIEYCVGDRVDLGIVRDPPETVGTPSLEYLELDRCERVLLLSQSHPLAGGEPVALADLKACRFVCNRSRDDALYQYLRAHGGFTPRIVSECDDDILEANIVAYSDQVSFPPMANYLKLRRAMPDLPLTAAELSTPLPKSSIGIVRRSGRLLSAQALALCAGLQAFFDGERAHIAAFQSGKAPK